jgi:uncharacterized protein (TIGR03437 family)
MLHLSTWPAGGLLQGTAGIGRVEIAETQAADLDVMLTAGSGILSVPSVVTIPAGSLNASFPLTPNASGVTELTAVAGDPGYETAATLVAVTSDAGALSIEVESGDEQAGAKGAQLALPVVLRVRDRNRLPYSGIAVTLSASDDSLLTPARGMTDADGRVEITWRLGSQQGTSTLTARLEQAPAVQATATALVAGGRPNFSAGAVANAASYTTGPPGEQPAITPGSLYSIFGTDLALDTAIAPAVPITRTLAGTVVRINGVPVPLLYVSPAQINLQVPFELEGAVAEIVVETSIGASAVVQMVVRPIHPGLFFDVASGIGAVVNLDGTLVSERPAQRGEFVQIFATGLGAVEPAVTTGVAAAITPLSVTVSQPRVTIGGQQAEVQFSGLAPFLVGVYQINARVPASLAPGRHALRIEIAGVESQEVVVEIQ